MTTPSFKGGQERMGPPSFELKVPFAALEWIADVGLVDIRPASPLGFLLTGARTYYRNRDMKLVGSFVGWHLRIAQGQTGRLALDR